MAVITGSTSTEITDIDFSGEWLNLANSITLQNNVNFESAQDNTYEDVLLFIPGEEPSWNDRWCGHGIEFNPATRAVTAGTLTGFVATDGGVQQFAVEGFSFSAVAFYNAMVSATPDDELAFVRTVFSGNDTFNLSTQADNVWAWTGNDTMRGNGGNDTLYGDAGNDWLDGGTGGDLLYGGIGNDTYVVSSASDVVNEAAGGGTDTVRSSSSRTLGANQENLVLIGTAAINGSGNTLANTLTGNAAANSLNGSSGNDRLNGAAGNDTLNGGTGADSMTGSTGNDTYYVDNAGDVVTEASGGGTDTVRSSVTRTLGSYQENLVLNGSAAINGTGNTLANTLTGNTANNSLSGGSGNDRLSGAAGNDVLNGGLGNDTLTGSTGLDQFRFTSALNGTTNVDRIADFVSADDRFSLDDAAFVGIGPVGALAAAAFRAGAAAADPSDRIVYNAATGALSFDADGNGAGAAVVFAMVSPGASVVAGDFFII